MNGVKKMKRKYVKFSLLGVLSLMLLVSIMGVSAKTDNQECNGWNDLGKTKSCSIDDVQGVRTCEREWEQRGWSGYWDYSWSKCIVEEVIIIPEPTPIIPAVVPHVFKGKPYFYPNVSICRHGSPVYFKSQGVVLLNLPEAKQFGDLVVPTGHTIYPFVCN